MLRIIRLQESEQDPGNWWIRVATLNNDREAVVDVIEAEASDPVQYVAANEADLGAFVLANGVVDQQLTAKLRAREAKQMLADSRLEGKTLTQVENYIETNVTDFATAKAAMKEMAGQVWMLYQVAGLTLEALDD